MNMIQAYWCELAKPLKIIFWVIVGIVVVGVIWLVVKSNAANPVYRVNDIVVTDRWQWVGVVNLDEVLSGNNEFSFGDHCGIGGGDKLQIIGIDDGNYLLRVEKENQTYGTPCPNGILFFMDFSTVESMIPPKWLFEEKKEEKKKADKAKADKATEEKKIAEEKIKAKVKRLIDKYEEVP